MCPYGIVYRMVYGLFTEGLFATSLQRPLCGVGGRIGPASPQPSSRSVQVNFGSP